MSGLDNTSYTVRTDATTTPSLSANDYVLVLTNTSAKVVTVPAASAVPGRTYIVVNTAAGAATLTPVSGNINGAATFVTPAGTAAGAGRTTFISTGSTWWTLSGTTTA